MSSDPHNEDTTRPRAVDGQLWQTLQELEDPAQVREWVEREFPEGASEWRDGASRREFMQLMGAAMVMSGLAGCSREPEGEVVPYVKAPEEVVPGEPLFYASAFVLDGFATGVLVESHAGRPTKIEGNPEHPASLGGTDAFAQAATWGLYNPERSRAIIEDSGEARLEREWSAFRATLRRATSQGQNVRLLTETITSPTLAAQLQAMREQNPNVQWHQWSPINQDNAREGTRRLFGQMAQPVYDFEQAEVIISLDADFLHRGPGRLVYARQWANRRKARFPDPQMNRMYALEATYTVTGTKADHRLRIDPRRVEVFLRALAARLGVSTAAADFEPTDREQRWIDQLADELDAHRGASIMVPGTQQPAAVHALAHAVNAELGNIGRTVSFVEPPEAEPSLQTDSLRRLAADIDAGEVDTLLILGGNPVYDAPADLAFGDKLDEVGFTAHLSAYVDETSQRCDWHVPRAHFLEEWTDARALDGTATIMQPLIAPLYGGRSAHEVVEAATGGMRRGHVIVMDHWREQFGEADFARMWRKSLHDGVVPGTMSSPLTATPRANFDRPSNSSDAEGLCVIFAPDPGVWDGRFSNIGMLQELPNPLSSLTWDNAALMGPATAEELGVENEDVVELNFRGRSVEAPVWVLPGHADGCVTLRLGYGKTAGGSLEVGRGFDAYALRPSDAMWFGGGLQVEPLGRTYPLAATQGHHRMEGRPIVEHATLEELREERTPERKQKHHERSLYPEYEYDSYKWGMVIDQTICTGCKACVAACQSENNIPIVGKEEVRVAREMHWLRVDTYYEGPADAPNAYHQPVPCMHCEKAPCELVCPVAATTHSAEGINQMTYNRCIGTRYCSNNCPYKVRRFNFFDYAGEEKEGEAVLDLKHNPDVSVRSRGVMEKCTYCIQRINAARIEAKKQMGRIPDGELQTACQQVCPTQAIVFGDLNDPKAKVTDLEAQPHDYVLLEELNTRPRTSYLTAIQNPNPEMNDETDTATRTEHE